jgi:hypothetical protein
MNQVKFFNKASLIAAVSILSLATLHAGITCTCRPPHRLHFIRLVKDETARMVRLIDVDGRTVMAVEAGGGRPREIASA